MLNDDKESFSKTKKTNTIKRIRTLLWYEAVKLKLKCSNAHQIELFIRNNLILEEKLGKENSLRNSWYSYQHGKHAPRTNTLLVAEMYASGTSDLFLHPFWDVLKVLETNQRSKKLSTKIDSRLSYPLKNFLYARDSTALRPYTQRIGESLIRRSDLDALVALINYWLISKQQQNFYNNHEQAENIYSILLILGVEFSERKLFDLIIQIFLFFNKHLFKKTLWENSMSFKTEKQDYIEHVYLLRQLIEQDSSVKISNNSFLNQKKLYQALSKLLTGKSGYHIKIGFKPVLTIVLPKEVPESHFVSFCYRTLDQKWGLTHIEHGTRGVLPCDPLWLSLKAEFDMDIKKLLGFIPKAFK
ncbi:MAG: hypothetical protein ACRCXK_13725 [Wohlfahrtiimonas sp.]